MRLRDLLLGDQSQDELKSVIQRRLLDGNGETLFDLGHEDSGESMELTKADWDRAWGRLQDTAKSLRADCRVLASRNTGTAEDVEANDKDQACSGRVMIRQAPDSAEDVIETRIAVVGNGGSGPAIPAKRPDVAVDAGKSTMLGVLVKGGLDDGRGKARVNLFRHKHEVESGRTSSVGMEIMGFDTKGDVITSKVPGRKLTWEEIGNQAVSNSPFCHYIANP